MDKKPLQIILDKTLITEIKISALREGVTTTQLIERILKEYLKKQDKPPK